MSYAATLVQVRSVSSRVIVDATWRWPVSPSQVRVFLVHAAMEASGFPDGRRPSGVCVDELFDLHPGQRLTLAEALGGEGVSDPFLHAERPVLRVDHP